MNTKGTKLADLARVTCIDSTDGITNVGIMEMTLLGTGEKIEWRPSGSDWEHIIGRIAPVREGDEIAIQGFLYGDTLRRVRYTCRGRSFRGVAAHRNQR